MTIRHAQERAAAFVNAVADRMNLITLSKDTPCGMVVVSRREALREWGFSWITPAAGIPIMYAFGTDEQFAAGCPFIIGTHDERGVIVSLAAPRKGRPYFENWRGSQWLWEAIDQVSEGQLTRFAVAGEDTALLGWLAAWEESILRMVLSSAERLGQAV